MSLSASLSASSALRLTPPALLLPSPPSPSPSLPRLPHSLCLHPIPLTLSLPSLFNVLFKWLGHLTQKEIDRGGKWAVHEQGERQQKNGGKRKKWERGGDSETEGGIKNVQKS